MSFSKWDSNKSNIEKVRTMFESKSHNDFVHQLNLECSFIDYFLILGYEPKLCLNNDIYTISPKDLHEKYKKEIFPTILTQYPPIQKSFVNVDETILSLCFPEGFQLNEFSSFPKPQILTFLFDNNYYSTEHPLKYITCLIFYENLTDYYNLKMKIKKEIDNEILKTFKNKNNSINEEKENNNINRKDIEKFYLKKVICLISVEPFFKEQEEILIQVYKSFLINKEKTKIPMEKIILNIIKTIPIPPLGIMEIKYKVEQVFNDIIIKRHPINILNNVDEYLEYMFLIFSLDDCLDIFKYTLYEIKTIVFSKNINNLCTFIFGLINLLFPFQYPFQVSSCLPKEAYNLLESVSPYILGINENYSQTFIKKYIISRTNFVVIDLDNEKIIENFKEKFPDLPSNLRKKIKQKIKKLKKGSFINESSKSGEFERIEIEDINEKSISSIFYYNFFINVMLNYSNFITNTDLKKKNKIFSIKNLFKVNNFITSQSLTDEVFYKKFTGTQMFNDFIFKKMLPKDINETIGILFFDESIIQKNNKMKINFKIKNTPFLKSEEYDYIQLYQIPFTEPLTLKEKNKYENKEFLFNNLFKGQFINDDFYEKIDSDINNKNNDNELTIKYYLFPVFNDDYFNETKTEYFSFSSMKEDIHHINADMLSKSEYSNVGEINNKEIIKNYLYLIYIELWANSYWYQESIEKKFRFKQLLQIINKINNHEIELYNLLFESLNKSKEEEKILQLYDKLFSHNIRPSSYIYSLINSIKKNKKDDINPKNDKLKKIKRFFTFKKSSNDNNRDDNTNNIIYNFKLRTFLTEKELNILGDKVYFSLIDNCSECNRKINIYNLTLKNNNILNIELWARCPYCKSFFMPLLTIYLGSMNLTNQNKIRCFLHSPYELKKNIKNIFNDEKILMLDIDNFKNKYPDLFWNTIWYFFLYKIDFSFLLPYETNINKLFKNSLIFSDIETKIEFNSKDINNISKIKIKK